MKLISIALFAWLLLLSVGADEATAARRWFSFQRRACRANSCGTSYSPVQKSTPVQAAEPTQKADASQKGTPTQKSHAQAVAERKAWQMASQRRMGHYFHGAPYGPGYSAEGVGTGSTPQQALNNCCRFRSPIVAQATARGINGLFYAVRLYR